MKDTVSRTPLLCVRRLTRRFAGAGAAAVSDLDLDVRPGEILALVGPSGCGKTTTLRLIAGFDKPDGGEIALDGADLAGLPPERRGIGFVFQDYALFPHLSVAQNIRFGLHRRSRAAARGRVDELLDMVGLSSLAGRMPHQLSGGQQQRVALARALAPAPGLVLMDEPFSNLDAIRRVETRQEVRALLRRSGAAAIIVTHDQEEALALADRIALMDGGAIIQSGTPEAVYRGPATENVARFLGGANVLEGEAQGGTATTLLGRLPLDREAWGRVRLSVRPEQIVLTRAGTGAAQGSILGGEFRGHDRIYWVRVDETDLVALVHGSEDFTAGGPVGLSMRDSAILLADG